MLRAGPRVLVATMLAFPLWSHAEIKDASANGFTIENARVVPVDAATAFRAAVEDIDRWWPRDHTWWGAASKLTIDARAGGCFCERAGEQQALHMLVTFVDPGRTLRLVGGLGPLQGMGLHGALEFRFTPLDAGGTRITWFYRVGGYTPEDLSKFAPVVDRVQAVQLGGLATHLGAEAAVSKE
jgi:hypothetical protein